MALNTTFRINSPNVVQETIDGEVVIVHLKKGNYYSLLDTGAAVWANLEKGMCQEQIIVDLINCYDGEVETITKAVGDLLTQLQEEEIIIPVSDAKIIEIATAENSSLDSKPKFVIPSLGKYTDMEELLALDPIHEVDEMGWPNAKIDTLV
jgi:hypothetical protein